MLVKSRDPIHFLDHRFATFSDSQIIGLAYENIFAICLYLYNKNNSP
jgi:hypothetical protein